MIKQIIKRNLPLNVKYVVLDKKYIPLFDSFGTCCDNCGKLIANIATVSNEANEVFTIGFDCMEKPYNTNVKIKDMDFNFLITTIKAILPKLNIIVK